MTPNNSLAPPWSVSQWFNAPTPPTLEDLRGRVVVLHAFQMLCPACVSHGLPQALRVHQFFAPRDLVVLGLHTVFEHHAVMGPEALRAFLHEYRIPFPVGVDQADGRKGIPATMRAYGLRGTPSLVVIDRQGRVQFTHLGLVEDLQLGALLATLVAARAGLGQPLGQETVGAGVVVVPASAALGSCQDGACPLPQ
ncbi:MAG: redoxin family protein [Rhodoferax sp.]|nr:redoxin family protein [Rhodoferax sp.]